MTATGYSHNLLLLFCVGLARISAGLGWAGPFLARQHLHLVNKIIMAATMTASFLFLVSCSVLPPKSKLISCQTVLTAARNADNVLLLQSSDRESPYGLALYVCVKDCGALNETRTEVFSSLPPIYWAC